jgi:hypothetical protein
MGMAVSFGLEVEGAATARFGRRDWILPWDMQGECQGDLRINY